MSLPQTLLAHKVEISGDVGGTIHIEPNDNPRAGEPSLVWIALTRSGGEILPLADCTCKLAIYAQPRTAEQAPLATPELRPVTAEGREQIPGAEVTLPEVGSYEFVISGKPQTDQNFEPFQLSFEITVATAATPSATNLPTASPESVNTEATESINPAPNTPPASDRASNPVEGGVVLTALFMGIASLMAIAWWLKRKVQRP
ncbi:MAG: hypothetical protein AAGG02_09965 [Cyanobacteria bacterium P01_H01_bin.15]